MTTYQWQRGTPPAPGTGWANITGATSSAYVQQTADEGDLLRVVTDTNGTSGPVGPVPVSTGTGNPYYIADFADGTYGGSSEMATIWQSYTVDPRMTSYGYLEAPTYDAYGMTLDTNQRVHLTSAYPAPAPRTTSRYVSFQQLRSGEHNSDSSGPFYNLNKASIRPLFAQTWGNRPFAWGDIRWFSGYIYFPWNNPAGLYFRRALKADGTQDNQNFWAVHDASNPTPPVTPVGMNMTGNGWLAFIISGGLATDPYNVTTATYAFTQLWNSDNSPVLSNFNRWHFFVFGAKWGYDKTGATAGWVKAYWNDLTTPVVDVNPRAVDYPGEQSPYLFYQNYSSATATFTATGPGPGPSTLFWGNCKAGLSMSDVL